MEWASLFSTLNLVVSDTALILHITRPIINLSSLDRKNSASEWLLAMANRRPFNLHLKIPKENKRTFCLYSLVFNLSCNSILEGFSDRFRQRLIPDIEIGIDWQKLLPTCS